MNSAPRLPATLPYKWREAAWRGIMCRCPRCEGAAMFGKWLKPVESCKAYGQ